MNKKYSLIVGVYNANGGILGEIKYVMKKISGQAKCSFCSLTHGLLTQKQQWAQFSKQYNIKAVHANQQNQISPELHKFTSNELPCIVGIADEKFEFIYRAQELDKYDGDTLSFIKDMKGRMDVI